MRTQNIFAGQNTPGQNLKTSRNGQSNDAQLFFDKLLGDETSPNSLNCFKLSKSEASSELIDIEPGLESTLSKLFGGQNLTVNTEDIVCIAGDSSLNNDNALELNNLDPSILFARLFSTDKHQIDSKEAVKADSKVSEIDSNNKNAKTSIEQLLSGGDCIAVKGISKNKTSIIDSDSVDAETHEIEKGLLNKIDVLPSVFQSDSKPTTNNLEADKSQKDNISPNKEIMKEFASMANSFFTSKSDKIINTEKTIDSNIENPIKNPADIINSIEITDAQAESLKNFESLPEDIKKLLLENETDGKLVKISIKKEDKTSDATASVIEVIPKYQESSEKSNTGETRVADIVTLSDSSSAAESGNNEFGENSPKHQQKETDVQNLIKINNASGIKNTESIISNSENTETSEGFYYQSFTKVKAGDVPVKISRFAANISDPGSGLARITLNPASLGTVFVEITIKDAMAKIKISAEKSDSAKTIESQVSVLKEMLGKQGIQTESIEIKQSQNMNQSEPNASGNQESGKENGDDKKTKMEYMKSFASVQDSSMDAGTDEPAVRKNILSGKLIEKYI